MDDKKVKAAIKQKRKKSDKVTFQTHPVLLEKLNGDVRTLAIYHFYKSRYMNSTMYNFSYNKVAKDLKMSWRSAKHYIDTIVYQGLARHHGNNLTFIDVRKVGVAYKIHPKLYRTVKISRKYSLKDIEDILYTISLNNYCVRQDYAKSIKHDRNLIQEEKAHVPYKRVKKILRMNEHRDFPGKCYEHVIVSTRSLAKKWKVSPSKVSIIIRRLKSKHLIDIKHQIHLLNKQYRGDVSDLSLKEDDNARFGYLFNVGSYLYIHRGTSITSISYLFYTRIKDWLDGGVVKGNQIDCAKMSEA